jgi:hypothetical protein
VKRLLPLLLLCACKAFLHGESHRDQQTVSSSGTVTTGGGEEEYASPTYRGEPLQDRLRKRVLPTKTVGFADAKSQDRADSLVTEKFDFLHSPLTWIGAGVVILVLLGGIGYAVFKARKVAAVIP